VCEHNLFLLFATLWWYTWDVTWDATNISIQAGKGALLPPVALGPTSPSPILRMVPVTIEVVRNLLQNYLAADGDDSEKVPAHLALGKTWQYADAFRAIIKHLLRRRVKKTGPSYGLRFIPYLDAQLCFCVSGCIIFSSADVAARFVSRFRSTKFCQTYLWTQSIGTC
jgi:hypothetical protein